MSRNPTTWDEYQYGTLSPHRSSVSSTGTRSGQFSEPEGSRSQSMTSDQLDLVGDGLEDLRPRRSSITARLNNIAQIGGVNSIENFARSWQRAAGFLEVTPRRPSFILAEDDSEDAEAEIEYGRSDPEYGRPAGTSLIRTHLDALGRGEIPDESAVLEGSPTTPRPLNNKDAEGRQLGNDTTSPQGPMRERQSLLDIASYLGTSLGGSYGTSYGTLRSTLDENSMIRAGQLFREHHVAGVEQPDGEREPLIVREVKQDGKVVLMVAGQSTLPQTIFNSTNVLIGVGLLSLPMGLKYAGWVCGMIFLALSALVTAYTASLLAKCMDVDASLITFADIAFVSYGQRARIVTSILFTLELLAACVALVVLFGDTLDLLIPGIGVTRWKILCGIILTPLTFAPLRLLSLTSILGIFSCFSIVLILFIDGFVNTSYPGSLLQPAPTYLFPANWLTLPLSFGLLMSPWGGHSVFPNLYRDMRHPAKFKRAIEVTFSFTYILDCATAVAGILMFGDDVRDEITSNIIGNSNYPQALSILITIFIAIIPLTKLPLNARPIVSTIEMFCGINASDTSSSESGSRISTYTNKMLKISIRIFVILLFVIISIVFPAFDSIMAFMGSTLCFTICVILPLMFYLKLFGKEISLRERIFDYFLIFVCSVLAIVGTVWAFLPKSLIGAE
ncbi:transmembrane amino acid transporter protein-domain-containing protein [Xylogone sp. PMI_703]|nr:transmembrane amino acid transporter protein-domain-containing protein [Xylogone sp. PMI_703]